jgi:arsenate reductase
MAEGILSSLDSVHYQPYSAGTQPSSVNPFAVSVMKEIGVDISGHKSKNVKDFLDQKFDYVITVCDQAKEACPFFPGEVGAFIHKGFEDPAQAQGREEEILDTFRKIRDEIKEWIETALKKGQW